MPYKVARMTCIPVAQVRAGVEEAAKEMQVILEPASNSTGCRPARRSTVRIRKLVFSRCLLCSTCHVPTSHAISITGHTGATGLQLKACLILVAYIKDSMSKDYHPCNGYTTCVYAGNRFVLSVCLNLQHRSHQVSSPRISSVAPAVWSLHRQEVATIMC